MKRSTCVMAIYPNAVGFGYAIMENPLTPIDCRVVCVKPISNKVCLQRIEKLIGEYEPKLILIQKLTGKHARKSKRVIRLLKQINGMVEARDLEVEEYSREQIRFVFNQFNAKNRFEIAMKIIQAIPQFEGRLPTTYRWWMPDPYSMGMFDAVSLVMTHSYMTE